MAWPSARPGSDPPPPTGWRRSVVWLHSPARRQRLQRKRAALQSESSFWCAWHPPALPEEDRAGVMILSMNHRVAVDTGAPDGPVALAHIDLCVLVDSR